MENISSWKEIVLSSFYSMAKSLLDALPNVFGAIVLLLLGWFIAKGIAFAFGKILHTLKADKLAEKINATEFLEQANIEVKPSQILKQFVFWVIILFFTISACETLGWTVVSKEIGNLIRYLPQLMVAIIIFLIGIYIANVVRKIIHTACESLNINSGRMISGFVFYLLLVMITLTALDQANVDITIITSNLSIIIGGIMLAFAISYGFAAREILSSILASIHVKGKYQIGDTITIDDISGKVTQIDSLSITIQTETEEINIPGSEILSKKVKRKING